jgi:5-methylcytosine-specific restriction endonuclease McrA
MGVLKDGIFIKKKDQKRIFTKNDKDLLWLNLMNHSKRLNCPNPLKNRKCKRILSYDDAEVDHKWAHSKGGPTTLQNAQLLCSSCNPHKRNK